GSLRRKLRLLEDSRARRAARHGRRSTSSSAVLEQPKFPPQRAAAAPAQAAAARPKLATGLGIVVFSMDNEVVDVVNKAVRGRLPVYNAGNIVQVVKC